MQLPVIFLFFLFPLFSQFLKYIAISCISRFIEVKKNHKAKKEGPQDPGFHIGSEKRDTDHEVLADEEECVLRKGESVRKEGAGKPVQMLLFTHIVKEGTKYCSWYNW